MMRPDPTLLADDLCELLHRDSAPQSEQTLVALILESGDAVDGALAEVARRGLLTTLMEIVLSSTSGSLLDVLLRLVRTPDVLFLMCHEICQSEAQEVQAVLERILLTAGAQLPQVFSLLIEQGDYEYLLTALQVNHESDTPTLRALAAARPTYGMQAANDAAQRRLKAASRQNPYDLLIVPGFTPVDAAQPVHLHDLPPAESRVQLAAQDLRSGLATTVLVSGGSVHPPGTPYNEALMMRTRLLELGILAEQILVDPHARHSTTNLRNAGRMMRSLGISRGLIVTGFDRPSFSQAFYFAHAGISTFNLRCQRELGYSVGTLREVDAHHIAYTPSDAVERPSYSDPLDV